MDSDLKWMQKLFLGICFMVIGAFIFFQTKGFTMFLAIAIGVYAVVNGVIILSTALRARFSDNMKRTMIIRGAISLGVGLLAILLPILIVNIAWTISLYLLGIQLVISAVLQIYLSIEMRRISLPIMSTVIEIIISLLLAFLVFTMPQEIGRSIVKVSGSIVFVYGLILVVYSLRTHMVTDKAL